MQPCTQNKVCLSDINKKIEYRYGTIIMGNHNGHINLNEHYYTFVRVFFYNVQCHTIYNQLI